MNRKSIASSFTRTILIVSSLFLAAGCLPIDEADRTADNGEAGNHESGANTPPTISGSPQSRILVDQPYAFQPRAYDADGDNMTFSVDGLPAWAAFDEASGRISGTPNSSDIATFDGLSITVSDGLASATLGPFSVTVDEIAMGSATLSWLPPTLNTDGTPLMDLSGYRIYWGTDSGNYTNSVTIDNPGLTAYVVDNLTAGSYYFVSTALNSAGVESNFSNEAQRIIQN